MKLQSGRAFIVSIAVKSVIADRIPESLKMKPQLMRSTGVRFKHNHRNFSCDIAVNNPKKS